MEGPSFEQEIALHLHKLSTEQQMRVLTFVKTLAEEQPCGVRGSRLLKFAGVISPDDLKEMEKAIAEGCEQVNLNEW